MNFADLTEDVDEPQTIIGVARPPKKLKVAEDVKAEAEKAKVEEWNALASSRKFSLHVAPSNDDSIAFPACASTLVERTNLID